MVPPRPISDSPPPAGYAGRALRALLPYLWPKAPAEAWREMRGRVGLALVLLGLAKLVQRRPDERESVAVAAGDIVREVAQVRDVVDDALPSVQFSSGSSRDRLLICARPEEHTAIQSII